MFKIKPKNCETIAIQRSILYSILNDIEAIHERVRRLAYYQHDRPAHPYPMGLGMGMGVGWGRSRSPSSPSHVTPWYAGAPPPSSTSSNNQDEPNLLPTPTAPGYTPTFSILPGPSRRRTKRPRSPAPVFRERRDFGGYWNPAGEGNNRTPVITRMEPDQKWRRDKGQKKKKKRKRPVREEREESESESEEEGSEHEDEDGDGDVEGPEDQRRGHGGGHGHWGAGQGMGIVVGR